LISEKVKNIIELNSWRGAFMTEIKLAEKECVLPTT